MATSSNSSVERRRQQLLNISHLAEILELLKKYQYSGTDYYDLGLHLGLSSRTLDIIAKDNTGDFNSCLRECLKAWLEQADNVKSNGGPTYYSLIKAMRKIEQNTVADGIDKEKHPACVIFAQCEFNQSVVDCLPLLAILLYKEKIIAEMVVPTTAEASSVLLKAVKEAVCADYHNLEKFIYVLRKLVSQVAMANSLLKDYKKAFPDEHTSMISREHVEITLPLELYPEFIEMRQMFADLIVNVARAMRGTSCDELKRYVRHACIHLRLHLAQCQDAGDIIELIGDQCSLINIALLEGIVMKFKVDEAKSAIQCYKDEIKNFYQEGRPLRQFLDNELSSSFPLQCKAVTITVNKAVNDYELKDINVWMTFAFKALAPNVKVVVIRKGESFTIPEEFARTKHQFDKKERTIIKLQDSNADLQKQLDAIKKQDNEQQLYKQLKAFVDELQEEKNIAEGRLQVMKEHFEQQLNEKDIILTLLKEKGEALQNKKQEEFTKKEKELSELQQLCHSKKEELAKTENEFKHQLEEKEQKIQEYSHMLQVNKKELEECQDALCTQQLKNESQNIQLLHHSSQVVLLNDEQQSNKRKIKALTMQLEETERKLELKKKEIQEWADTLYQHKVNESSLNVHKVNHISQSTQYNIDTADNATQVQEEQGNIDAGTQCDLEVKSQGTSIGVQFDYLVPLTDKLQGVCVAGHKLFLLQNDSPQLLNWEEYGLKIAIPQGAVQQSDTVEVAITALVGGEFILPENTELVSAVYAISVSKLLLKPVQLEIQHCVSIEEPAHSNYLSFATAPSDCPPYHFQPVKGGKFPIGNQYGSIALSGFSKWLIYLKKKFRLSSHSQSSVSSSSDNYDIISITDVPPQSPSADALPSPTHAQSSPPDSTPSVPPDDTLPSPSNTSPLTTDTAVPLSPSSNPPLSSSPAIVSSTFSPPSTDNTAYAASSTLSTDNTAASSAPSTNDAVASSANASVELSSSISSTVDDSLQHSVKDESPVKNKSAAKEYFGQVIYEKLQPEREWLMRFILSKDLNALKEFIRKEFQNFNLDSEISFNFEDDGGYIELCFDTDQCTKGWSVIPHEVPTKISQSTIDSYGRIFPPLFPQRLITITFSLGGNTEPKLTYPVSLKGIESDTKQLNIVLTIGDHHSVTDTTTTAHTPSHDEGDTAKEVFRNHCADLYDLLTKLDNISALAVQLYSKELITEGAYDKIRDKAECDKAESILHALKATISIRPQSQRTLIEILRRNDALKVIADKMSKVVTS